jgi:hypothetical protein
MNNLFHPFGDGVRIGGYGASGDVELAANLADLCRVHGVSPERSQLNYPDGTVLILSPDVGKCGSDVYLSAPAYGMFMEMIEGGRA